MIHDQFLAVCFPKLPGIHDNETMASKKTLPTSFLTLPSELRQDILIRTYRVERFEAFQFWNHPLDNSREWLVDFHNTNVKEWTNKLQSIDEDIIEDVEYVTNKWLEEVETLPPSFLPSRILLTWADLFEGDRKAVWKHTQNGGEEPWNRIHRKPYILNRQWYHNDSGKERFAYVREWDAADYPPWDKQGGAPQENTYDAWKTKRWNQGPSKTAWMESSRDHHPSTWKKLLDAVDGDIAWIVQREKEYREELAPLIWVNRPSWVLKPFKPLDPTPDAAASEDPSEDLTEDTPEDQPVSLISGIVE